LSCRPVIVVEHSSEALPASNRPAAICIEAIRHDQQIPDALVVSLAVIVRHELADGFPWLRDLPTHSCFWILRDHRALKKRVWLAKGYGSFQSAWRTLQGIETVHMIRKGRVRWLAKRDAVGQAHFIAELFGLAA
jgi:DDE domain